MATTTNNNKKHPTTTKLSGWEKKGRSEKINILENVSKRQDVRLYYIRLWTQLKNKHIIELKLKEKFK